MAKIYKYKDYEEYVEWQTKTNKSKITWTFVREDVINKLAKLSPDAKNIICHGTRNGTEQKHFLKNFPNAYIIGTEISDTATQFEMTVQHDFMEQREEWIEKFDIVYSNSFDHSIRPEDTLAVWKQQLNQNGHLFLEYSEQQSECIPQDPLDAKLSEVERWVVQAGFSNVEVVKGVRGKNNSCVVHGVKQ